MLVTSLKRGRLTLTNLCILSYGKAVVIKFRQQIHLLKISPQWTFSGADDVITLRTLKIRISSIIDRSYLSNLDSRYSFGEKLIRHPSSGFGDCFILWLCKIGKFSYFQLLIGYAHQIWTTVTPLEEESIKHTLQVLVKSLLHTFVTLINLNISS